MVKSFSNLGKVSGAASKKLVIFLANKLGSGIERNATFGTTVVSRNLKVAVITTIDVFFYQTGKRL